jgi:rod shape-determining protein MreC
MERLRKNKKSFISVLSLWRRAKFYFLFFVAFILIFIALFRPQIASNIKIAIIDTVSPAISFINRPFEEASDSINSISNIAALKAENTRLKAENNRLKEWYQTALMLQAENKSLQSLLNLKIDPQIKYISARTLSDTQNAFSKTILIAAGAEQGIKKNQVVLGGEGVLGRIIEVGQNTSRVLLINDINSRIPITIENINKQAILSGNNEEHLLIQYLEFISDDMIGKKVITTGEAGVFPPGLSIGEIIKIKDKTVFVQPFVQTQNIEFVRILEGFEEGSAMILGAS